MSEQFQKNVSFRNLLIIYAFLYDLIAWQVIFELWTPTLGVFFGTFWPCGRDRPGVQR